MIAEYLNRGVVLDELQKVRQEGERQLAAGQPQNDTERFLLEELSAAELREAKSSSGQRGFELKAAQRRGQTPAPLDDYAFISQDPIICLLQSALDQFADQHPEEVVESAPHDDTRRGPNEEVMVSSRRLRAAPQPLRANDGRRIFDKFSITDPRWIRSKLSEGVRLFRGKHEFNDKPAPPIELPSRSRLVLVGDWGSGLDRAQKVAKQMRAVLEEGKKSDLTQHVVHLGDVYYSGWAHEYQRRFLPYWPVYTEEANVIGSWALNSNHDMYSGGYGYFDLLLADSRFERQQRSSVFSLRHPDWNILGLDTAWDEAVLHGGQVDWLCDQLTGSKRNALLLSHHQLFSAYDSDGDKLAKQLDPILEAQPVKAWFWGHEHRCVAYSPNRNVEFGRCVGHGGIPVYMWHGTEDAYPAPAIYEDRRSYTKGLERWALFGFTVLDFNGPEINVRYIDENGQVPRTERIA
jgi:hypothetical protein